MKPRLVVNNSGGVSSPISFPHETCEKRLAAAWRAMQSVIQDHVEGTIGEQETLDILAGYLTDPRLNEDALAVQG